MQHTAVMEEDEDEGSMDEAEYALRERRRLVTTVRAGGPRNAMDVYLRDGVLGSP